MLDLIISGEISLFYESLILLLILFVYNVIIFLLTDFQNESEKTLRTVINIIPIEQNKNFHSYKFKNNIACVNNMDLGTYSKNVASPVMMLKSCLNCMWMYKDIYNTAYLYIYLVYTIGWGYLAYMYFLPRIIKCFTSII